METSQHFLALVLLTSELAHSLLGAHPEHCGVMSSMPDLDPLDTKNTFHQLVVTAKNVS